MQVKSINKRKLILYALMLNTDEIKYLNAYRIVKNKLEMITKFLPNQLSIGDVCYLMVSMFAMFLLSSSWPAVNYCLSLVS